MAMRRVSVVLAAFAVLVAAPALWAGTNLTPKQAAQAVGRHATVCGKVSSVHFSARSRGHPTFVNLGAPYPHQDFTILIWGNDRPAFNPPPESWMGKTLCVTGRVKLYRGTPEVVAYAPDQIRLKK